jgi:AcrR family transcriptional regulator
MEAGMARNADRSRETRQALLSTARALFARLGYAGTSTEAILAAAGLTRGALYHHFRDKAELFAAVCEDLQVEAETVILAAAEAAPDPYQAVEAGCLAFLDFMVEPEVRRILLIDAPSVLGWTQWSELDRRHGFGLLVEGVRAATDAGAFSGDPLTLAVLINGALNYGVVWAGQSEDPAALSRLKVTAVALLRSLRR